MVDWDKVHEMAELIIEVDETCMDVYLAKRKKEAEECLTGQNTTTTG